MNKSKYYLQLAFVIIIWGIFPLMTVYFYNFFSAMVYTTLSALISAISFTILSRKMVHQLNRRKVITACITGLCYSLATIVQMIGLQYTTPSMFAFLENTTCVVVPALLFLITRKKLHPLVVLASIICLVGCFVLSNVEFGVSIGIGEILCALAGVLYSGNIVGTGLYAKDIDPRPYLMIQKWIHLIASVFIMLCLHFWRVDGVAREAMRFDWQPGVLLLMTASVLISSTLCWLLRTTVIQHVDMTVVSIAMPISAVITMVLSVLLGTDVLSINLVAGAAIILFSLILSGIGEQMGDRAAKKA